MIMFSKDKLSKGNVKELKEKNQGETRSRTR